MTTLREAAQQALEALEYHVEQTRPIWKTSEAIAALEAALAEPVQEPFCYVYEYDSPYGLHREFYPREYNGMKPSRTVPLYIAPPQRKPLPLKDVERLIYENTKINPNVADDKELLGYIVNAIRVVERAHNIVE